MKTYRVLPLLVLFGFGAICGFGAADGPDVTKAADDKLSGGDLPGAAASYQEIATANPDSLFALQGLAYSKLLAGDYDAADKALADAEAKAKDDAKAQGEIKLRRAIVALRKGDLDNVKLYGKASGLPAGAVLAGEVFLSDSEVDEAKSLFKKAAAEGDDAVKSTAETYLQMLDAEDSANPGLAEATAAWALGLRQNAVEVAEELVKELPEDDKKASLMLLWAGRAVTAGRSQTATNLLDAMSGAPPDQAWRMQAIRAMIMVADGDVDNAVATLDAIEAGGAPADGMADARATAAALAKDAEAAKRLAGSVSTVAVARGLFEAGATDEAKSRASGNFGKFVEAK